MRKTTAALAAAAAFMVGSVTGATPSGSAPAAAACKVVSGTTTWETAGRPWTSGPAVYDLRRSIAANTVRCGSEYRTTIRLGTWMPVIVGVAKRA